MHSVSFKTLNFLDNWLPPVILRRLQGITGSIRWSGDYDSWAQAQLSSHGYNSELVLKRVYESALKVKNNEAAYERDGMLFNQIQYSWPVLAGLLWIAAQSNGTLNIIDFGGSLGTSYFQNRNFLGVLREVKWNIVEQPHFVDCGNKYFEDENLKFFYDIETCIALQMPNAILLSCVIQYLENPYKLLEKISAIGFKFIIFDRTAFYFEQKDRLTLQKVHTKIYEASYPAWFLNKKKFFDVFTKRYKVVANWSENIDNANIPSTFEGGMLEQGKCLD